VRQHFGMPRRASSTSPAVVAVVATVASLVGAAAPAHAVLPADLHPHVVAAPAAAPHTPAMAIDPTLTAGIRSRMAKSTSSHYDVVVDIAGVGRVVDINGGTELLPASTEKLFTSLPLLLNRAQSRLVTTVGSSVSPIAGILRGDLVVRASADPTVMGSTLQSLANQVHASGVSKVTGQLVLNIGSLPATSRRTGWKTSYVPEDIGPLSPFPVHEDSYRSSASYVAHATADNLALFRDKLSKAGVAIAGGSIVQRSGNADVVLATYTSPTLTAIIQHALRYSDNFQAEQMLSILGSQTPVNQVATAAGAGGSATDGSGLSLRDRRSARDVVALLEYAAGGSAAALLKAGLPIACQTGTLQHEMCHTVAAGKVFAKTGSLDHVKALAGYTTDAQGRVVTFAFLTNGDTNTSTALNAIERSVILLRHYGG
jgi:D-alanyl-D-alanine carboxypeptidase/D-alanyl-D-alanine-endopeptidase (penicillin-binding protein 4)